MKNQLNQLETSDFMQTKDSSMKFLKDSLSTRNLVSGQNLETFVYTFDSQKEGPTVYIQSSIHGAEIQGSLVVYDLMKQVANEDFVGKIFFVPLANPYAINQKSGEATLGRFEPTTGENYNRFYFENWTANEEERKNSSQINIEEFTKSHLEAPWLEVKKHFKSQLRQSLAETIESKKEWGLSYNQSLCGQLQTIANQADIVLDLHTGPISSRHLYSPEYARTSAKNFNIPHTLLIPIDFAGALDEASFGPWWALHQGFKKLNRETPMEFEAFTIELGSQEFLSAENAKEDVDSILSYLQSKGVLVNSSYEPKKMKRHACFLKDYKTLRTKSGGVYEFVSANGEFVKKGQEMARRLSFSELESIDQIDNCMTPVCAPDDGVIVLRSPSSILHQGAYLFKIMTHCFDL